MPTEARVRSWRPAATTRRRRVAVAGLAVLSGVGGLQACARPTIEIEHSSSWGWRYTSASLQDHVYSRRGDRVYVHIKEYQSPAPRQRQGESLAVDIFAIGECDRKSLGTSEGGNQGKCDWRAMALLRDGLATIRQYTVEDANADIVATGEEVRFSMKGLLNQLARAPAGRGEKVESPKGMSAASVRISMVDLTEKASWIDAVCAWKEIPNATATFLECPDGGGDGR